MSSIINLRPRTRHWPHPSGECPPPAVVLVVVDGIADVVDGAVECARALRPRRCLAVHVRRSRREAGSVSRAWAAFHPDVPLGVVDPGAGSMADALGRVIANQRPSAERPVVVVVPRDLPDATGRDVGNGVAELVSAYRDRDDVIVVAVSSTTASD